MQYDKPNAQERVGHSVDNLLVDCCESERVDNCSVTKTFPYVQTITFIYDISLCYYICGCCFPLSNALFWSLATGHWAYPRLVDGIREHFTKCILPCRYVRKHTNRHNFIVICFQTQTCFNYPNLSKIYSYLRHARMI